MEQSESQPQRNIIDIPAMLKKLNEMYDKEDNLKKQMIILKTEYMQLQEDKEMLQMMIMHQSNKIYRQENYMK
jgi:hypothetical protein